MCVFHSDDVGFATLDDYLQLYDHASQEISKDAEHFNGTHYHPGVMGSVDIFHATLSYM